MLLTWPENSPNLQNQPEDAKRAYLAQLHRRKAQGGAENSPSSSSEGGLEDGISSTADLLAYTKKLKLSEDDAKKVAVMAFCTD